jgi:hypothetical protein
MPIPHQIAIEFEIETELITGICPDIVSYVATDNMVTT